MQICPICHMHWSILGKIKWTKKNPKTLGNNQEAQTEKEANKPFLIVLNC